MPKNIYIVQLDGMEYDIEGDRPPTEQDVRGLIGQGNVPQTPPSSVALKDFFPTFSATAPVGKETTITPTDIISGTMPIKAANALSEGIVRTNLERLNRVFPDLRKPLGEATSKGIAPIPMRSIADIGMRAGAKVAGRVTPENIVNLAVDPRSWIPTATVPKVRGLMETPITAAQRAAGVAGKVVGKPIDYLKKSRADYVTSEVAPRAYSIYQQNVQRFTPEIQLLAEELKVPKSAIQAIKKWGVNKLQNIRQTAQDSTDAIYRRIQEGFLNKKQFADDAYKTAIDAIPDETIDMTGTMRQLSNIVKGRLNLVDETGNATANYTRASAPYKRLADMYMDMKNPVTAGGKRNVGYPLTKEQWAMWRDELGNLIKERPADRVVMSVRNSLYNDAENELRLVEKTVKRSMPSLTQARQLESEAINAERTFGEKFKEGKLDRFHNLTDQDIRDLKTVEKHIGDKFVDELDAITASRELDKFDKIGLERFQVDLNQAIDRKWTVAKQKELEKMIGKDQAKKIIDEIIAHRRGRAIKKVGLWGGGTLVGGGEIVRRTGFGR